MEKCKIYQYYHIIYRHEINTKKKEGLKQFKVLLRKGDSQVSRIGARRLMVFHYNLVELFAFLICAYMTLIKK